MKKLILSLIVLLLASCGSYREYRYKENAVSVDYSLYSELGFFITEASSVSFEYEPVGHVSIKIYPGYESYVFALDKNGKPQYDTRLRYADIERGVYMVMDECLKNNADGVIKLKYDFSKEIVSSHFPFLSTRLIERHETGLIISGMAIKRKQS